MIVSISYFHFCGKIAFLLNMCALIYSDAISFEKRMDKRGGLWWVVGGLKK